MLARRTAERPQRVLQSAGESGEALAAEHHLAVFEATEGEPEMVQAVVSGVPAIVTRALACR